MAVVQPGVREPLRCLWMCFACSVPSKKTLHSTNISFSAHAIAQPCRHTSSKAFRASKGLFGMLQVRKNVRFQCAAGLVSLRSCAPKREHYLRGP